MTISPYWKNFVVSARDVIWAICKKTQKKPLLHWKLKLFYVIVFLFSTLLFPHNPQTLHTGLHITPLSALQVCILDWTEFKYSQVLQTVLFSQGHTLMRWHTKPSVWRLQKIQHSIWWTCKLFFPPFQMPRCSACHWSVTECIRKGLEGSGRACYFWYMSEMWHSIIVC